MPLQTSPRDRLVGGLGSAIFVGLLGYVLLAGLNVQMHARIEEPVTLLDLQAPPVPPPPLRKPPVVRAKARKAARTASPRNLRQQATEVASPVPIVPLPVPPPLVSAPKPDVGMAPAAGASDRPGPGSGAGGQGDGTGGGGDGDGLGGDDTPPRQIRGHLKFTDLPPALRALGVGGSVGVRYRVEVDGSVRECRVTDSSGNAELDQLTCQLIERRFRFKPARDPDGRPFRSTIEESHSWIIERVPAPAAAR